MGGRVLRQCLIAIYLGAMPVAALAAGAQGGSQADSDDAINFGGSLKGGMAGNIGNGVAESNAQSIVPNYTNPPETAYAGQQTNQSTNVANRRAYCASHTNDVSCEALNYSNTVMLPPSLPSNDPALRGLTAETLPESVVGSIAGAYGSCSTTTSQVGANVYDRQYCNEYFRKTQGEPCQKTLLVSIIRTPSCTPGTWFAYTDVVTHGNGDPYRYAGVRVSAYCDIYSSQMTFNVQAIATEPGAGGSANLAVSQSNGAVAPQQFGGFYGRSWYFSDVFNGFTYNGGSCNGDNCSYSFSTWYAQPDHYEQCGPGDNCENICADNDIVVKQTAAGEPINCLSDPVSKFVPASNVTRATGSLNFTRPHLDISTSDAWANACSGVEARVPANQLLADGDNSTPPAIPTNTGSPYKCERVSSVCVEPAETRIIDGVAVYRSCWRWENKFACIENDPRSDCGQPRFGSCGLEAGSPTCEETDPDTGICLHKKYTYKCLVNSPSSQTQLDCGNEKFCVNGICYDTSHPNDPDFAKAVTMMEGLREGGRYLDPATQRLFKGADNRCKKKLWGAINCCNRANNPMGALNNFMMMTNGYAAVTTASVYVFDTLFANEIPNAGMVASLFQPGPWAMVAGFVFAANLSSCSDDEKALALKRDQRLCIDIGDYCSDHKKVVGCLEKTHTYCCYNSRLSRIINEQGRPLLGIGLGGSQNPGCDGFTIAQLQSLDFSQIDFREFYQEILPTMLNQTQTQSAATAKVTSCYAGAGRC